MQINIISIGTNMPAWINDGYQYYAQRLPKKWHIKLIEIPSKKRKSSHLAQLIDQEGQQLLAAAPAYHRIIALERSGQLLTSEQLAQYLERWQLDGTSASLLIGGPEGLSPSCCQQADNIWSLSALTFPHPLVRVILVEQIYRAYTILQRHPYHR